MRRTSTAALRAVIEFVATMSGTAVLVFMLGRALGVGT